MTRYCPMHHITTSQNGVMQDECVDVNPDHNNDEHNPIQRRAGPKCA